MDSYILTHLVYAIYPNLTYSGAYDAYQSIEKDSINIKSLRRMFIISAQQKNFLQRCVLSNSLFEPPLRRIRVYLKCRMLEESLWWCFCGTTNLLK